MVRIRKAAIIDTDWKGSGVRLRSEIGSPVLHIVCIGHHLLVQYPFILIFCELTLWGSEHHLITFIEVGHDFPCVSAVTLGQRIEVGVVSARGVTLSSVCRPTVSSAHLRKFN